MTREAVIVSTARTPVGRAFRGAYNDTHGAVLAAHVIRHAVARAGIGSAQVDDVVFGCGFPEGATGWNVARTAALSTFRRSTSPPPWRDGALRSGFNP